MKKLTTLAIALPIAAFFGLCLPAISSAQSVSALQAQINALIAQVQALEQQLTATQNGSAAQWCYTFTSNLGIGASGNDVLALNTALQKEGFDPGEIGPYSERMASAVSAFQEKYRSEILDPSGLAAGTGYVGAATRAKLNALYGCGAPVPPPLTPAPPIVPLPPVTPPSNPTSTVLQVSLVKPIGGETFAQGGANVIQWNGGTNRVEVGIVPATASKNSNPSIIGWISVSAAPNSSLTWDAKQTCDLTMSDCQSLFPGSYKVIVLSQDANGNLTLWNYLTNSGGNWDISPSPFTVTGNGSPSGNLNVTVNSAVPSGSVIAGSATAKIGSYVISNPSAEPVIVPNITVQGGQNASLFQNFKVMVGGIQYGITLPGVPNNGGVTFSGSLVIPANNTAVVDVYADVLSSGAAGSQNATALSGCTGVGKSSDAQYACNAATGQTMTVVQYTPVPPPTTAPTLNVTTDPANLPAGTLVTGSTGNNLLMARFTAGTSEDVKLLSVNITDSITNDSSVRPLTNLQIYSGATLIGQAAAPTISGNGAFYQVSFSSPVIVPKGNSVTLILKADVPTLSSGGTISGAQHIFTMNARQAVGVSSSLLATLSGQANSNQFTVAGTTVTVSAVPLGTTAGRSPSAADDLATVIFTANPASSAVVDSVALTLSGTAVPSLSNQVSLVDFNGQPISGSVTSNGNAGSEMATFNFGYGGYAIPAGSSVSFKLRVNSSGVSSGAASATLTASIAKDSDVQWHVINNTVESGLTSGTAPVTLAAVTYAGETVSGTPAIPANQAASCNTNNGTVTLSWSPVAGSTYTVWYYDTLLGASNGGTCGNGVTCANLLTSPSYQFAGSIYHTYKWAVFAYNGQQYSNGLPTWNSFTCGM